MLDEAGRESFPASDPPAVTPAVTLDPADHLPVAEAQQEPPPLVEIKEHPVSDPSAQTE